MTIGRHVPQFSAAIATTIPGECPVGANHSAGPSAPSTRSASLLPTRTRVWLTGGALPGEAASHQHRLASAWQTACDGHSAGAPSSLGVLSVNGNVSTPNDGPAEMSPRPAGTCTALTSRNVLTGQDRRPGTAFPAAGCAGGVPVVPALKIWPVTRAKLQRYRIVLQEWPLWRLGEDHPVLAGRVLYLVHWGGWTAEQATVPQQVSGRFGGMDCSTRLIRFRCRRRLPGSGKFSTR